MGVSMFIKLLCDLLKFVEVIFIKNLHFAIKQVIIYTLFHLPKWNLENNLTTMYLNIYLLKSS